MTETPIYRLPRFTAPFSFLPNCAVNRDFPVFRKDLYSYIGSVTVDSEERVTLEFGILESLR